MFLSKGGRRWEFVGVIHQILGCKRSLHLDKVIRANVPKAGPLGTPLNNWGPVGLQMLLVE
jgi:hypothetical protein